MRVCATPGCGTVLSEYNDGKRCAICEERASLPRAWDPDFDARVLFALVRGHWLGRSVRLPAELGCTPEEAGEAVRRLRRWGCMIEGDPHNGRWLLSLSKPREKRSGK